MGIRAGTASNLVFFIVIASKYGTQANVVQEKGGLNGIYTNDLKHLG